MLITYVCVYTSGGNEEMCSIAGILSKRGIDVADSITDMLTCMPNRGPDGSGILLGDDILFFKSLRDLSQNHFSGEFALGHSRLAIVGGSSGRQPLQSCDGRFILVHNGEIYNYKEIRDELSATHKFVTDSDSEVIVHLIEQYIKAGNNFVNAIKKTVAMLDGIFAFAIRDRETGQIGLARDQLGVRQLYYTENGDVFAFASERKSLLRIVPKGDIRRVMPGMLVLIEGNFKLKEYEMIKPLSTGSRRKKISYRTRDEAISAYQKALLGSMKKRTMDLDTIGIIFSGGIDSVLVAYLAKSMVKKVVGYCGGLKGSTDIQFAKDIAKRLSLPLRINELALDDVESMLPRIVDVIEDNNVGQVEVAIPIFAAVETAHQDGMRVMYTGQGVDELFGGYSWYPRIVEREGYRILGKHMADDLSLLYKETLEREDKIAMYHSVEIREPYLDNEVVRVALRTNLELNVTGKNDAYGKRVHRDLAIKLGIPADIAYRKKEAAQHGSGIHDALDIIARNNGYDPSTIPEYYLKELVSREKIGSSQRYGYNYGDLSLWAVPAHIQLYLDNLGYSRRPAIEIRRPKVADHN
ncbi:MAG: asparagine synthase (glutamine-hydrolyzing) [Nitrososphaeraceae archaeon]